MDWREEGTILSARPHGESAAIIEVFTAGRGRHAGVVRGGASRRLAAVLQPGSLALLNWRARLDDHLGVFTVEPVRSRAGVMAERTALLGLGAVAALLRAALPERAPHPALHAETEELFDAMAALAPDWPLRYLRWENCLLDEMGYGLDLTRCAVTGAREGLAFVSPRTGRAVTRAGAGDWAERLLPLPACLLGPAAPGDIARGDILAGLDLTGHFLETRLAATFADGQLPPARARLVAALRERP